MKTGILVSVPTGDGWIHKHVCMATDRILTDHRYRVRLIRSTWNPFENNLHHIINDFMRGDEAYWLNIDADNPPMKNPLDLVALDKDIIGCPTPVWHYEGKQNERPIYWNAYKKKEGTDGYTEWMPREGLQKVDAIGTGCLLIARRVFANQEMRKGAFTRKLNADGTVDKGNDISFSERATEQGFEIWAHFDYPCLHFNELELNEVVRAFKGLGVK